MYDLTALVTLVAVLVCLFTGLAVSRARGTFAVKAPATAGDPDFERVFRAHMNTLEWMPIFLPSLWLVAVYVGDAIAAAIGAIWIIGRIYYFVGYTKAAEKRGAGFALQGLASIALWVGALGAVLRHLVH